MRSSPCSFEFLPGTAAAPPTPSEHPSNCRGSPSRGESARGRSPQSSRWGANAARGKCLPAACQRRVGGDSASAVRRSPGGRRPAPPHQPSPGGSTSATPPQGGSDTRVTNRGRRLHLGPGTWFTSCQGIGQEALCRPRGSLPPGGGVGETRAQPAVEPVGGDAAPCE